MKRLMPIFIVILLSGCGILTAYAPNMLSMIVVAVMGVVVLLGIIYGLIPVLTFTQGLLTGQKSIQRASEAEEKSVWITALQMDRFFRQKKMDQLFREYRDKVKQQRQNGQDNTCYGCIECGINTGQNGLHTAKCRLNRNEVNISKTPKKADKGT